MLFSGVTWPKFFSMMAAFLAPERVRRPWSVQVPKYSLPLALMSLSMLCDAWRGSLVGTAMAARGARSIMSEAFMVNAACRDAKPGERGRDGGTANKGSGSSMGSYRGINRGAGRRGSSSPRPHLALWDLPMSSSKLVVGTISTPAHGITVVFLVPLFCHGARAARPSLSLMIQNLGSFPRPGIPSRHRHVQKTSARIVFMRGPAIAYASLPTGEGAVPFPNSAD